MSKRLAKVEARPAWTRNANNSVLNGEGFFISYNEDTGSDHTPFTEMANMLGADVEDGTETALVIKEPTRNIFKILTGDWRKEYEKCWPNLKACIEFFDSKKEEHGNNWSTLEKDRPPERSA